MPELWAAWPSTSSMMCGWMPSSAMPVAVERLKSCRRHGRRSGNRLSKAAFSRAPGHEAVSRSRRRWRRAFAVACEGISERRFRQDDRVRTLVLRASSRQGPGPGREIEFGPLHAANLLPPCGEQHEELYDNAELAGFVAGAPDGGQLSRAQHAIARGVLHRLAGVGHRIGRDPALFTGPAKQRRATSGARQQRSAGYARAR